MHVVEKFHRVLFGSEGEYLAFAEFGIYLLKCSILLSGSRRANYYI